MDVFAVFAHTTEHVYSVLIWIWPKLSLWMRPLYNNNNTLSFPFSVSSRISIFSDSDSLPLATSGVVEWDVCVCCVEFCWNATPSSSLYEKYLDSWLYCIDTHLQISLPVHYHLYCSATAAKGERASLQIVTYSSTEVHYADITIISPLK